MSNAAKRLVKVHDRLKVDTDNTAQALRLQARAWRICALIGLADPVKGAQCARWLLFKTLPWVDGEAVSKFITDNQEAAEIAGRTAGVFNQ